MERRIAYIVSRFPHLPETFILREIITMEQLGWTAELFPLINQKQPLVHDEAMALSDRVKRPALREIFRANIQTLFTSPFRYSSTLLRAIFNNLGSPSFLARAIALFPKAVWMAVAMRRQGIDHVHAHYATHPALAAWVIRQLTGTPYSITVHAHDIFVNRSMLSVKLRDAACVVAISEFNRQFLVRHVGDWIADRTHVIHCGVDPDRYFPRMPTQRGGRFEILTVGSLQPYKGQASLIEACAILCERGLAFRCRIVGGGELRAALQAQINRHHLQQSVELLGPMTQAQVAALLPEADCYVQPSIITGSGKTEGIPVSLMEAMASQVPVVATSISGVPELVRPGETGLLVPPASPSALADALQEVRAHPAEAAQRARRARALILEEYDLHRNVEQLSKLLKSIA